MKEKINNGHAFISSDEYSIEIHLVQKATYKWHYDYLLSSSMNLFKTYV